ncbi:FLASH [Drosophila busckii]|uniref:FLASH n=1 Tax=Drosophila busckii TaxID=30019 RepID=A0A0M4EAK8_DROBS|nr:uncharacterized protein LOC108596592 [Drosophila busckii]ALC42134.1 FLASH [Drosophila busckii]
MDEELDIYDDLDDFQEAEEKKSKELLAWKNRLDAAQLENNNLQTQIKSLEKKIKIMEVNFQNLLDTGRSEIKRKDQLITQLRKEKDDLCFRRKHAPGTQQPVRQKPLDKRLDETETNNPFKKSERSAQATRKHSHTSPDKASDQKRTRQDSAAEKRLEERETCKNRDRRRSRSRSRSRSRTRERYHSRVRERDRSNSRHDRSKHSKRSRRSSSRSRSQPRHQGGSKARSHHKSEAMDTLFGHTPERKKSREGNSDSHVEVLDKLLANAEPQTPQELYTPQSHTTVSDSAEAAATVAENIEDYFVKNTEQIKNITETIPNIELVNPQSTAIDRNEAPTLNLTGSNDENKPNFNIEIQNKKEETQKAAIDRRDTSTKRKSKSKSEKPLSQATVITNNTETTAAENIGDYFASSTAQVQNNVESIPGLDLLAGGDDVQLNNVELLASTSSEGKEVTTIHHHGGVKEKPISNLVMENNKVETEATHKATKHIEQQIDRRDTSSKRKSKSPKKLESNAQTNFGLDLADVTTMTVPSQSKNHVEKQNSKIVIESEELKAMENHKTAKHIEQAIDRREISTKRKSKSKNEKSHDQIADCSNKDAGATVTENIEDFNISNAEQFNTQFIPGLDLLAGDELNNVESIASAALDGSEVSTMGVRSPNEKNFTECIVEQKTISNIVVENKKEKIKDNKDASTKRRSKSKTEKPQSQATVQNAEATTVKENTEDYFAFASNIEQVQNNAQSIPGLDLLATEQLDNVESTAMECSEVTTMAATSPSKKCVDEKTNSREETRAAEKAARHIKDEMDKRDSSTKRKSKSRTGKPPSQVAVSNCDVEATIASSNIEEYVVSNIEQLIAGEQLANVESTAATAIEGIEVSEVMMRKDEIKPTSNIAIETKNVEAKRNKNEINLLATKKPVDKRDTLTKRKTKAKNEKQSAALKQVQKEDKAVEANLQISASVDLNINKTEPEAEAGTANAVSMTKPQLRVSQSIEIIEDIRLPGRLNIADISDSSKEQNTSESVKESIKSTAVAATVMYAKPDSTKLDHTDDEATVDRLMPVLATPKRNYNNLSLEADSIEMALEQLHQRSHGKIEQPDETTVSSTSMRAQQDLLHILTQSPQQPHISHEVNTKKRANQGTCEKTPLKKRKLNLSTEPHIELEQLVPPTPIPTSTPTPTPNVDCLPEHHVTIDETFNMSNLDSSDSSIVTKSCSLGSSDYQFERINNEVVLRVIRRGRHRQTVATSGI